MDPKDRKKIQFSVPAPPSQLDPRAVEMIRRRRPTPAMLFQLSEHSSPGETGTGWEWDTGTWWQGMSGPGRASGEGCLLKPKRTNPCAYTPPSLKGTRCWSPRDMGTRLPELGDTGRLGQGCWSPEVQRWVPPPPVALGDRVGAVGGDRPAAFSPGTEQGLWGPPCPPTGQHPRPSPGPAGPPAAQQTRWLPALVVPRCHRCLPLPLLIATRPRSPGEPGQSRAELLPRRPQGAQAER
uniref:Protein phosphatase 1 regulatory subunit 1B n=1 Tax=Falco tinnunculus TaxID=100819 RepID=A0A8C4V5X0_FALTI